MSCLKSLHYDAYSCFCCAHLHWMSCYVCSYSCLAKYWRCFNHDDNVPQEWCQDRFFCPSRQIFFNFRDSNHFDFFQQEERNYDQESMVVEMYWLPGVTHFGCCLLCWCLLCCCLLCRCLLCCGVLSKNVFVVVSFAVVIAFTALAINGFW